MREGPWSAEAQRDAELSPFFSLLCEARLTAYLEMIRRQLPLQHSGFSCHPSTFASQRRRREGMAEGGDNGSIFSSANIEQSQ